MQCKLLLSVTKKNLYLTHRHFVQSFPLLLVEIFPIYPKFEKQVLIHLWFGNFWLTLEDSIIS